MRAIPKLLAEWFWTDRWMGSSAFLLPLVARGLYREMLTQAWRRGAQLPNDHEAIRRAVGATKREWSNGWPLIERYWRVEGDHLVNDTQVEIYRAAVSLSSIRSMAGKAGNEKRWGNRKTIANSVAEPVANGIAKLSPPSPSPSEATLPQAPPAPPTPQARSKHPVFKGNRLVVFEWQWDDLRQMLGKHADSFKWDLWFDTLDKQLVASGEVMPKRDNGRWLQQETLAEARRRGLPIAGENAADPYAGFTKAYTCSTCGNVHDGTAEQARRSECQRGKVAS